ncbi:hypothetical protein [Heyndrickxia oleronia]|uniref:hypothetical protein n=1 Tax=Heyndrickxia oleronia TaxID=38875 RepID=UPI001B265220|nr:hypothetical protein [Heyndrickxia oleronia]GIN40297.1 hypothetical protein J19TS1_32460 [Heyndrickxia oleronia]
MWKLTISFLFLLGLLSGCGSNQLNDDALTNNGTKDNKYREISTSQTNENPNMIDLKKGDPQPTVGSEVDKAKDVVRSQKGYVPSSVWINGNNMWVNVHTNKRLTHHERMKEESKLHKKLIQALPKYDINVKIDEQ